MRLVRCLALVAVLLGGAVAHAETIVIEASLASDGAAAPLDLDQPGLLQREALRGLLDRFSLPPTYTLPSERELDRAKATILEECERANTAPAEEALRVLERGDRDGMVMRGYECLLTRYLSLANCEADSAVLLARALSVLPDGAAKNLRDEWGYRYRYEDPTLEIQLDVPTTAGVFVNGVYRHPTESSPRLGDLPRERLRRIVLHVVPGEYFVQVDGFPPAYLAVSTDNQPQLLFSSPVQRSLRGGRLAYASSAERNEQHAIDASLLAFELMRDGALVYWSEGTVVHLSLVSSDSDELLQHVVVPRDEAPAAARRLLAGTASATPDLTVPQPGNVPVSFASGRGQTIVVKGTSLWPRFTVPATCETPCTVYLPPGHATVASGAPGVADGEHSFLVADTGNELTLRSPSRRWRTAGKVAAILGGSVFLGAGAAFLATCAGADALYDSIPGLPDNESRCPVNGTMGAILATSAAVGGAGLGIWIWNRAGIEDQRVRAAPSRGLGRLIERAYLGLVPSASGVSGALQASF